MKIALFALFFLLLTFTKAEYVYDIDGEPLPKGDLYYILTGSAIGGGFLTLLNYGEESCPLPVVVSIFSPEAPPPLPSRFWNSNLYRYTSTDMPLNFTFTDIPLCTETSKWFVTEYILPVGWGVMFGDAEGRPSVKGDFSIRNYEENYKIVFCPEENPETCGDLTTYRDRRGNLRLVVKYGIDDPLIIRFQKTDASSASGISMVV